MRYALRPSTLLLSMLLVVGCSITDADPDGDGYQYPADCDEGDDAIHEGAAEVCNGVDDDCDDRVDEGAAEGWYADADGDGYGDPLTPVTDCMIASGVVEDAGDCDDAEATVHPAADEICDLVDNDCDGVVDPDDALDAATWYVDADRDGYGDGATVACYLPDGHAVAGGDCDDSDSAIHPSADELCSPDGVDEDCDGAVDESGAIDASTWYRDADADGHGDPEDAAIACAQPSGHVPDDSATGGWDCDDGASAVNPAAAEVCNDLDDDCDGATDDDDPDLVGATIWYIDYDGDGYGSDAYTVSACEQPAGYIPAGAADCDDAQPDSYPGNTEVCTPGGAPALDEDCDGDVDESGAADAETFYADADADGYGDPDGAALACEAPSGHVADSTDCDDSDATAFPEAPEICGDGRVNDCGGAPAEALSDCAPAALADARARLVGPSEGELAASVSGAGDVDGDGIDDLIVGAHGRDSYAGAAYLIAGSISGEVDLSSARARLVGEGSEDRAGWSVSGGDVDGDGYADLLIGAFKEDTAAAYAGAVYVALGPASGEIELADAEAKLLAEGASDYLGWSVSGGDVDGDGYADLLTGARYADGAGEDAGTAWLVAGPITGEVGISEVGVAFDGEDVSDWAGYSVAIVGDTDGDGLQDLLIGAPQEDSVGAQSGAAYLVLGPATSDASLADADAKLVGEAGGDAAGWSVAGSGDVDGDGLADLLIGAPQADAGIAYLVLGPATGDASLADADAALSGEAASDEAGTSVAGSGDVDGDGLADLIVGAPAESSAASSAGAAYLVLGPVSGALGLGDADARFVGEASGDQAGWSVAGPGDVDGDGFDDALVGALYQDAGGGESGAAYLVAGGY